MRHIAYQTCFIFLEKFQSGRKKISSENLCEIFQISDLNEKKIVAALENNAFSDFEDGLQEECAVESMADYIVTRNPADFKHSRVKVILPDELLRELEKINYQESICQGDISHCNTAL